MSNMPLTEEQVSSWNNDGILLIKNVLPPKEVSYYLDIVNEFLSVYENKKNFDSTSHAHGNEYFHILNIILNSDKFDKFIDHEKMFDIITYLMGPYIQLMGVDLFVRKPNKAANHISRFHTDGGPSLQKILPVSGNLPIQLKVQYFLTDMDKNEMSNFIYIPGTHKKKVNHNSLFCTVPQCNEYVDKGILPPDAVQLKVRAGDVLIHPWSLWHCISLNNSDITRKSLSVRYGQMWLKPQNGQATKELLCRLTNRQKRLLCDFGDNEQKADCYRPPLDQLDIILGDKVEAFGWS